MEKLFGPDESSHIVLYTAEPLQTLRSFAMHLEYYEVVPKTSSLFLQTIAITHHLVNLVNPFRGSMLQHAKKGHS